MYRGFWRFLARAQGFIPTAMLPARTRRTTEVKSAWISVVIGCIGFIPALSFAHEFWLAPSKYSAGAGDTVEVAAFVGTGFRGERKPYATPRVVQFTLRGTKTLDLRGAALNGDLSFARFI